MERCHDYVGVSCVNGVCPVATAEGGRCVDVMKDCENCFYYEGCKDCALFGTKYCDGEERFGKALDQNANIIYHNS